MVLVAELGGAFEVTVRESEWREMDESKENTKRRSAESAPKNAKKSSVASVQSSVHAPEIRRSGDICGISSLRSETFWSLDPLSTMPQLACQC